MEFPTAPSNPDARLHRVCLALIAFLAVTGWGAWANPSTITTTERPGDQPAGSAQADSVRRTVAAAPGGVVQIDQVTGSLRVSGWDRPVVEVTGRLGRDLDSVLLERRGDRVLLRMKESLRGRSADLSIRMPAGSRLEIQSMSLDLRVTDVAGAVDVQVTSGTQRVTGAGAEVGPVRLETVSGVLFVDGVLGELELVAVSGPVDVDAELRRLAVDTVNGPQDLRVRGAARVEADSLNGPLELDLAEPSPRLVARAGTFNGSLRLGLAADAPARVEATARRGRIDNRLGGDEESPRGSGGADAGSTERTVWLGGARSADSAAVDAEGGVPEIRLSTFRGDIVLRPLR